MHRQKPGQKDPAGLNKWLLTRWCVVPPVSVQIWPGAHCVECLVFNVPSPCGVYYGALIYVYVVFVRRGSCNGQLRLYGHCSWARDIAAWQADFFSFSPFSPFFFTFFFLLISFLLPMSYRSTSVIYVPFPSRQTVFEFLPRAKFGAENFVAGALLPQQWRGSFWQQKVDRSERERACNLCCTAHYVISSGTTASPAVVSKSAAGIATSSLISCEIVAKDGSTE